MKIKRIIFAVLGVIFLELGTIGVFLPILPTTPFYLLTLFFFANSYHNRNTFNGLRFFYDGKKSNMDTMYHYSGSVDLAYPL